MLYIPTQQQRIQIYNKIQNNLNFNNQQIYHSSQTQIISNSQQFNVGNYKKLTKQQITSLVNRLTKDTKRQYAINQQIKTLQKINKQKHQNIKNSSKVQQRLLKAGQSLLQKKQKLIQAALQKQSSLLQQFPQILPSSKTKITKPLLQRLDQIIQSKQQHIQKLSNKYNPIFKPQLNPHSLFIAEINTSKNFLQRLQQYNNHKKSHHVEKINRKQQQQMQGVTFNPTINQHSKKIIEHKNKSTSLQTHQKISNKDLINKQHNFTFQPQINKKSVSILKNKDNYQVLFHERLYKNMKSILTKKQQKLKSIQSQHTFKPKINRKSLKILQNKINQQQLNNNTQNSYQDNLNQQYQQIFFYKQKLFPSQSQTFITPKQSNQPPSNLPTKISSNDSNKQNINTMNYTKNQEYKKKIPSYSKY